MAQSSSGPRRLTEQSLQRIIQAGDSTLLSISTSSAQAPAATAASTVASTPAPSYSASVSSSKKPAQPSQPSQQQQQQQQRAVDEASIMRKAISASPSRKSGAAPKTIDDYLQPSSLSSSPASSRKNPKVLDDLSSRTLFTVFSGGDTSPISSTAPYGIHASNGHGTNGKSAGQHRASSSTSSPSTSRRASVSEDDRLLTVRSPHVPGSTPPTRRKMFQPKDFWQKVTRFVSSPRKSPRNPDAPSPGSRHSSASELEESMSALSVGKDAHHGAEIALDEAFFPPHTHHNHSAHTQAQLATPTIHGDVIARERLGSARRLQRRADKDPNEDLRDTKWKKLDAKFHEHLLTLLHGTSNELLRQAVAGVSESEMEKTLPVSPRKGGGRGDSNRSSILQEHALPHYAPHLAWEVHLNQETADEVTLVAEDGRVTVEDVVHGSRLDSEGLLAPGDEVVIGNGHDIPVISPGATLRLTPSSQENMFHRLDKLVAAPVGPLPSVGIYDAIIIYTPATPVPSSDDREDISYRFSDSFSLTEEDNLAELQALGNLEGAFVTLYQQTLSSVTMDAPTITTVERQDAVFNLAYSRLGSDFTLILGVSELVCSRDKLRRISEHALTCFAFAFGPLDILLSSHVRARAKADAIQGESGEEERRAEEEQLAQTKEELNIFFRFFFRDLAHRFRKTDGLPHIPDSGSRFASCFGGAIDSSLPIGLREDCTTALCEHLGQGANEHLHRPEATLAFANALFHRGLLVESQCKPTDLKSIARFLAHFSLLTATSTPQGLQGRVVLWKQVHGLRKTHRDERSTFLLVLGEGHTLFCVLLKAWHDTTRSTQVPLPAVDHLQIGQAEVALTAMRESGLLGRVEHALSSPLPPIIARADFASAAPARFSSVSVAPARSPAHSMVDAPPSPFSQTQMSSYPDENESRRSSFMSGRRKTKTSTKMGGVGSAGLTLEMIDHRLTLSSTAANAVFHYLSVDGASGIVVSSDHQDAISTFTTSLQQEITDQFHAACVRIRALLMTGKLASRTAAPNAPFDPFDPLEKVYEHGLLFKVDASPSKATANPATVAIKKKKRRSTSAAVGEDSESAEFAYWVVGRLFTTSPTSQASATSVYPREFYVCFRDGTSQNLVEMAFKLHFGYPV